jgi:hypothetical protein
MAPSCWRLSVVTSCVFLVWYKRSLSVQTGTPTTCWRVHGCGHGSFQKALLTWTHTLEIEDLSVPYLEVPNLVTLAAVFAFSSSIVWVLIGRS